MKNFSFYNPVQIYFGKNAIANMPTELAKYGKNVLLTYGGGSIKKNGIYDNVISILEKAGKNVFELSGIMPNPRTEKVYEGIELCRKHNIDLILAVGGGSTVDCSKFIAAGAKLDSDFWQTLFIEQKPVKEALPLGVVLTMAATGSEMNSGGVISKWDENLKLGFLDPSLHPKFSILDPEYTISMPKEQVAYGCVDIFSHIMEQYFSTPDDDENLTDYLAEALFKNLIVNAKTASKSTSDYTARANIMWDSTMALNGLLKLGKSQDWMGHQIAHGLSAFYDTPHGAALAIAHPAYLKYICKNAPRQFVRFAKNIWNVSTEGKTDIETALEGLEKTTEFFKSIGAPTTLKEVGIPKDSIEKIVEKINLYPTSYANLTREDLKQILLSCAE